ncbi:AraC family transcriptional regulator [Leptospira yasudae]|uniref:AraC family transcriptional regulator n=1 Tax=Leptospira yasudae TaxID=2202201 RepID=UPI001C4FE878|nr:helix-turn-helix domain-containing protein [Leptospira yasudae]MBW0432096.1 AraC family transcriptional regulator [Leptospira yasudae]
MYFLIALIAVEKLKLMIPNPYSSTITLVGGIIYIVLPIFLFSNLLIITPPKKEFESLPKSFEFKKATGIDLLVNLDNEKIMFKLYDLFVHERIFLDEDLRLPTLSEEMGLSVHQLSAFINRHLRTNFNTFVNYFRLKEAMSMLIEEPSRSILSICMAVGFNGMSTFQRFFLYATNTSPSKYREAVVNGEKIEFSPLFQPIAFEIHQFEEQYLRRCEHRAISELTM